MRHPLCERSSPGPCRHKGVTRVNIMSRRNSLAAIFGGAVAAILPREMSAQFTEQEVRNGLSVVSTGDVDVDQAASGNQVVDVNGVRVEGDGVYQTTTGQVVVNDGQVVATGDVSVNQTAFGNQEVSYDGVYPGMVADQCLPGHVIADPRTGRVFYQAYDCCYYEACARKCDAGTCVGAGHGCNEDGS
jgi:hypothetical protein